MFDAEAADRAIDFFPTFLRINDQRYHLPPWQQTIVRHTFGWKRPDGTRRFRQLYLEVPRGNSKTMLLAGLSLLLLFADFESAPEIYPAASDKTQAAICFNYAERFIDQSPELAARCKVYRSRVMEVPATHGILRVLSSDAKTKHGLHGSGIMVDELHAHTKRDLFETLCSGIKTRRQPLVVQITTAGQHRAGIGWEQHQYAAGVVDGTIDDDSFLPVLYSFDDERDDWADEAVWRRLNPNWGVTVNPDEFRRDFRAASQVPAKEAHFRQTGLCQWVDSVSFWLPMQTWDEAAAALPDLDGLPCWAGLDLSSQLDLTAVVLVFRDNSETDAAGDVLPKYLVLPFFFVPEETAQRRHELDKVPYLDWGRQGFLMLTPGGAIREAVIHRKIKELSSRYSIQQIAYDPWRNAELVEALSADGFSMVKHPQDLATMSPSCELLESLVVNRRLLHGGHPVLRWNAKNTVVYRDPNGSMRPHKGKSADKIDGLIATLMALTLASPVPPDDDDFEVSVIDT